MGIYRAYQRPRGGDTSSSKKAAGFRAAGQLHSQVPRQRSTHLTKTCSCGGDGTAVVEAVPLRIGTFKLLFQTL